MKIDNRPKKGMWAPGEYFCRCFDCYDEFMGDKRSMQCADCAYQEADELKTKYDNLLERECNHGSQLWEANRAIEELLEKVEKAYTQGWEDGCHNRGWSAEQRKQRVRNILKE